jgi:hypothetical protein
MKGMIRSADHRIDDPAESAADDHAHGEIHDVALDGKLFELLASMLMTPPSTGDWELPGRSILDPARDYRCNGAVAVKPLLLLCQIRIRLPVICVCHVVECHTS